MPLKEGSDKSTVSFNIRELIKSGKEKGHIGTSPPKSGKALRDQAAAIAYRKAGKSRNQ
jgi:hypothetical protein